MNAGTAILTLSHTQADELAGKRWVLDSVSFRFAGYDRYVPGEPPWESGAEGIAYPLLGTDGKPHAYVKFFEKFRVTPKRIARTKWLIEQRIDNWASELRGVSRRWLDTRSVGRPRGTSFDFTGSMCQAVLGKTWLQTKLELVEGAARFDEGFRQLCVENLIRGLVCLEQADMVHGDLSHNNLLWISVRCPGSRLCT